MGSSFPYPGWIPQPAIVDPSGLIANASNVRDGENPSFTTDTFYGIFPQFQGTMTNIPVLEQFIAMANACVKESRWHDSWKYGTALFVAHFTTLYLQTMTGTNPTAGQVIAAAQAKGLQTSKSVGDVSVSYDFSSIGEDLNGWAAWKTTEYGLQFATMGKLLGKGGMYVY